MKELYRKTKDWQQCANESESIIYDILSELKSVFDKRKITAAELVKHLEKTNKENKTFGFYLLRYGENNSQRIMHNRQTGIRQNNAGMIIKYLTFLSDLLDSNEQGIASAVFDLLAKKDNLNKSFVDYLVYWDQPEGIGRFLTYADEYTYSHRDVRKKNSKCLKAYLRLLIKLADKGIATNPLSKLTKLSGDKETLGLWLAEWGKRETMVTYLQLLEKLAQNPLCVQLSDVSQETGRLHFVLEMEIKSESYKTSLPMMIAYMNLIITLKNQGFTEEEVNKLLKINIAHSYCMPFFRETEKKTILDIFLNQVASDNQLNEACLIDKVFPLLFKLIESSLLNTQDVCVLESKAMSFFSYLIDHLGLEKLGEVNESLNNEKSLMSIFFNTIAAKEQKQTIKQQIEEKVEVKVGTEKPSVKKNAL